MKPPLVARLASCLAAAVACPAAIGAPPPAVAASPVKVQADWFSCTVGRYAVMLPKYYPTLHGIGRHRFVDLEVRQRGAVKVTTRRIEYYGLRLDVQLFSNDSSRYVLLRAESTSRRWNIGKLSVGQNPWRWSTEKSLDKVSLNGPIELVGTGDMVTLVLTDGRIDKVTYSCRAGELA